MTLVLARALLSTEKISFSWPSESKAFYFVNRRSIRVTKCAVSKISGSGKYRSTIKMRTSLAVDGTLAVTTTTSTSVAVSYLVTLGGAFLVFSVSIERSKCVVNSS